MLKGELRGEQCSACGGSRAVHDAGIDGQTDAPLDLPWHGTGKELVDIGPLVSERDQFSRGLLRPDEAAVSQPLGLENLGKSPILAHGETMPVRERGLI